MFVRIIKISGHCAQHQEEEASNLTPWEPMHRTGIIRKGWLSYVYALLNDTGLDTGTELRTVIMHRTTWKQLIKLRGVRTRPK